MVNVIWPQACVNARVDILDPTVRDYVKVVWTKHVKVLEHVHAREGTMAFDASKHAGQDVSMRRVMRHRDSAHAWTTISESSAMKHVPLFALNANLPPFVRDVLEDITAFPAMKPVVSRVYTTRAILLDDVLVSPATTMNRIVTKVQLKQY